MPFALSDPNMVRIIEDVVYQHAENACSLWQQRQHAVEEPHYSYTDLVHLDDRLEANLDGMRIAGEAGDPMLNSMADVGDGGACFAQALLALERGNRKAFWQLVEIAETNDSVRTQLESALAWIAPRHLQDTVRQLLESSSAGALAIGLRTCAAHGRHPGAVLAASAHHGESVVRIAACRTAADLGDRDFLSVLAVDHHEDDHEHFEQCRTMALLGRRTPAMSSLRSLALGTSAHASNAVSLLMLMSNSREGRALLKQLDGLNGRARDTVRGFGLLGDPVAVDWLIDRTSDVDLARLAGGSITMVTGVDIAYDDLELEEALAGSIAGTNDDPADDNVALDEDENLPWPDSDRLNVWWKSCAGFEVGTLYLDGREKKPVELQHVLKHGMQRQRSAASQSLALLQPGMPFRDTRFPTNRQAGWIR